MIWGMVQIGAACPRRPKEIKRNLMQGGQADFLQLLARPPTQPHMGQDRCDTNGVVETEAAYFSCKDNDGEVVRHIQKKNGIFS